MNVGVQDGEGFDKYRVIARLGAGGMADVFLAALRGPVGFQKLLVIKRLRADLADDPQFRGMLLDEARLAARLNHPNVVQTFEVGEREGCPFIAMEYLDGQPLHRIIYAAKRGKEILDPHIAAHVVAEALTGLHYAHELSDYDGTPLGIVHRDISPHNLFVTYDGEVKVVDFGIAKVTSAAPSTEVGVLKGKVSYMAPEQARGESVDRRSDIFAMGIVLWELLTRVRLFQAPTPVATIMRILEEGIPSISQHAPDVDPELEAICIRALARDPALRFQTAREMSEDLREYLDASKKRLPRRDEIGRQLRDAFAEDRARVEQRVEACMRGGGVDLPLEDASTNVPILSLGESSTQTGQETPTRLEPRTGSTASARSEATSSGTAAPSRTALTPLPVSAPKKRVLLMSMVGLCAGAAAALVFYRSTPTPAHDAIQSDASSPASAPAAPTADVILRMQGSNTVGAELAPALARAFLEQEGGTHITREIREGTHSVRILATMPGKTLPQAIAIEAEGSATAFDGLAADACDIGMSSRPIKNEESLRLASIGFADMRAPASEHVVALDGIAVIVHPNSPVRTITRGDLASVFSGDITDWGSIGAPAGPITVYARDDASGTFDTFKNLVLAEKKLAPSAVRIADSDRLSDTVAGDSRAIGFIGLAYVRNAKSLSVADAGTPPMFPSAFTVTTEEYLLSRRLYLYTSPRPKNALTLDFVNFALSAAGQRVVRTSGFVDLDVELEDPEACTSRCTPHYAAAVRHARRLSLDFRFRPGTTDLDSRGTRDIDRLLLFLRSRSGGRLMLLGFSDNAGKPAENIALSRARAKAVESELTARGVHAGLVDGLGPEMPIASNSDETGRERNRRVEVWLEPSAP